MLTVLLTACPGPEPRTVRFATDPGILRGSYVGTIDTRVWPGEGAIAGDGSLLALPFAQGGEPVELWAVSNSSATLLGTVGEEDEALLGVSGVALSGDGTRLALAQAGAVQLWNTRSMTLESALSADSMFGECEGCGVTAVSLDAEGNLLAVGGSGAGLALFDVAAGSVTRRFAAPSGGEAAAQVALSADGTLVAGAFGRRGNGYFLRVWDVLTGAVVFAHDYELPNFLTPALAFSADGHRIVTVAERRQAPAVSTVRVVEVATGRVVFHLERPRSLLPAALDPSGALLAVAEWNYDPLDAGPARLVIYDVASGEERAVFHDVAHAAWSVDGRFLLAGPRLIDAASLTVVADLVRGHLHELALDATPTYRDGRTYTVSGTLTLDAGPPIGFEGVVDGNESQRYLRPAARAPEPARFELELAGHPWRLLGRQPRPWADGAIADDPTAWVGEVLATEDGGPTGAPFRFWRAP